MPSVLSRLRGLLAPTTGDQPLRLADGSGGGGGATIVTTKGDLLGFDTTANRVPVGSDGDILTADSTAALGVSYQPNAGGSITVTDGTTSVSGATTVHFSGATVASGGSGIADVTVTGGGGGASNITPDTHPGTADPMDDEFEGSSLDPKWTLQDPGSLGTFNFQQGAFHIHAPTDGGSGTRVVRAIEQPVPSGNWEIEAKCKAFSRANYNISGMWIRTSGNGAYWCRANIGSPGQLYVGTQSWPSPGSFVDVYGPTNMDGPVNLITSEMGWVWFRIQYDGTNLIFKASSSGYSDSFIVIETITPSSLLGAMPTEIGLCCLAVSASIPNDLFVDYFRRIS